MVSDGDDNCTVDDLFNVTVVQENDQPTGVEDLISVVNGGTISVLNDGATNSVLSNDSDPESDPITAVLASPPNNGTLTFLNNGNFTYTHDGSATTTDSFTTHPKILEVLEILLRLRFTSIIYLLELLILSK